LEGTITELRGRRHLVLSVSLLQRSVAVQLENDEKMLIPLPTDNAKLSVAVGFQTSSYGKLANSRV
jgi:hypothetical protein